MNKPNARLGLLPLLLCVYAGGTEAKDHLSRKELKALTVSSVAVVYMDTDQPLEPYLDYSHSMVGFTPVTMIVADAVNTHRLNAFAVRIAPYQSALQRFSLPQSTQQAVQAALVSVPWLEQRPWVDAKPEPQDFMFLTRHAELARTRVVIFIHPQLMMDPGADALYLVSSIDIETADPPGANIAHYDINQLITALPIRDQDLPAASLPQQGGETAELRLARLFADDGAAFKKLYAELLQQFQQQLYYYFTSNKTLPAAAVTHAGP